MFVSPRSAVAICCRAVTCERIPAKPLGHCGWRKRGAFAVSKNTSSVFERLLGIAQETAHQGLNSHRPFFQQVPGSRSAAPNGEPKTNQVD
jgi:hypothetical protein